MEYSRDYKQKYTNFMSKLKPKVCVCVCVCACVRACVHAWILVHSPPASFQGDIPNYIEIPVRRDRLMEDSFYHIMRVKNTEHLKTRVMIKFQGEEGLDFGGLSR